MRAAAPGVPAACTRSRSSAPVPPGSAPRAARRSCGPSVRTRAPPSYILLEGFTAHAKTIQRYQKGKHVMAEPGFLDLRSDMGFAAGSREKILARMGRRPAQAAGQCPLWRRGRARSAAARAPSRSRWRAARRSLPSTSCWPSASRAIRASSGAPGEDLERRAVPARRSQGISRRDHPRGRRRRFGDRKRAGAGRAERCLDPQSRQGIQPRQGRQSQCRASRDRRSALAPELLLRDQHQERQSRAPSACAAADGRAADAAGEKTVECDRIIARLGAIPPRKFVESIGIKFPNERADAIPELSRQYESNVPGVYIIGSLAGYPLIKQAMNQGYDVVEFINGNDIKPADHPLLEYQFHGLPFERDVDEMVERFQTLIPMFRQLNSLAFRELVIESDVIVAYPPGAEYDDAERKMARAAQAAGREGPAAAHDAGRSRRRGDLPAGRIRHLVLHDRRRRGDARERRRRRTIAHAARARRILRRDESAVGPAAAREGASPGPAASWSRRRAARCSS